MKDNNKDHFTISSKKTEKFVTRTYLVALIIIGWMTILTHDNTTKMANAQQYTAEVHYNLSRQRANIQQVIVYSKRYTKSKDEFDKGFLVQSINEINKSYTALYKDGVTPVRENMDSIVLEDFYFGHPYYMYHHLREFIKTANKITEPPAGTTQKDIYNSIAELEVMASEYLVNSYDYVHEFYQMEAAEKITKLFEIQSMSVIFIIFVLCCEALFIFRPLVSKLSKYHNKLIKLALKDPLTGLNNRRAFISQASIELQRCRKEQKPVSVVLCDLDKFKSINDTYGHHVGDLVLKHFSKLMARSLRSGDITSRIGGEEFAILLPNCDQEEAFMIIDRFRENVATTPCGYDDENNRKRTLSYTGSFGVIYNTQPKATIEQLLSAADKNLYDAKETGRNKVVISALDDVPEA